MMDKEYEFDDLISQTPKKGHGDEEYILIEDQDNLQNHEGEKITFEGTIAMIPWQHLINAPDTHNNINYVNIGKEKEQVVVYSKEKIDCKAKVSIRGIVVKTKGKSKRPDSDEIFVEYQVVANFWECVKYGN